MYLKHLSLTNFRTFSRLDIDVPSGIVLLHGRNAQGKTSLLEAVYYLATFTSFLTSQENQVINLLTHAEPLAVSRIVADIEKNGKVHQLEIRVIYQEPQSGTGNKRIRKEILLDGVKKPASEVIGLFTAVVFIPQMTRLLENGPDERRKYLNMVFSQVIHGYAGHLTKFAQALTRRNALLKTLAEKGGDPNQLDYWDNLLAEHGAHLFVQRAIAVDEISRLATPIHARLTSSMESMSLEYLPSIARSDDKEIVLSLDLAQMKDTYLKVLSSNHKQDINRGVTTIGPHRDELRFMLNGLNLADYGSRGQVRSTLQSLKFAEVSWMHEKTGSTPVLLLDETLAELDEQRRDDLLGILSGAEQALLTTTDLDLFNPGFLEQISLWKIDGGQVNQADA